MSGQKKSKEYKYLERRIYQIEKNFKFNQSIIYHRFLYGMKKLKKMKRMIRKQG